MEEGERDVDPAAAAAAEAPPPVAVSETSLPSVVSEVMGDWGAVGRVKNNHRVSSHTHRIHTHVSRYVFFCVVSSL